MALSTKDFYYDLPEALIAQTPEARRDHSRLMVLNRATDSLEHQHFYDLPKFLKPGDLLVTNNTKVLPARIYGTKMGTGARVEFLLLRRLQGDVWETMVKPGKKALPETEFRFSDVLTGKVIETLPGGLRAIEFSYDGVFEEVLEAVGTMPLPPYIHETLSDQSRYQTVYAKYDGSAAAPTAGLHFTPELFGELAAKGVERAEVTLHVGLGTFRPVKVDNVEEHQMHSEYYEVSQQTADKINETKRKGGRVVAVGTTTVRTLESVARKFDGEIRADAGETDIFIYPGYVFQVIDALITNFHLPESTLLMLVSAFYNKPAVMAAYAEAIAERYRFFSFGDGMLIL